MSLTCEKSIQPFKLAWEEKDLAGQKRKKFLVKESVLYYKKPLERLYSLFLYWEKGFSLSTNIMSIHGVRNASLYH